MERGAKIATMNADKAQSIYQSIYVNQYNLRSKDKSFEINDDVLILIPDSTNRLQARW